MAWTDRWRRWWPGAAPIAAEEREDPGERAAAIGCRLAALELARLELLADESVPGRKHRLDALDAARRDLEHERDEVLAGAGGTEADHLPRADEAAGSRRASDAWAVRRSAAPSSSQAHRTAGTSVCEEGVCRRGPSASCPPEESP